MGIIINPGSENKGGTIEEARKIAQNFKRGCEEIGIYDIDIISDGQENDGNFYFRFKHKVTKKEIQLVTHGFSKEECEKFIFNPRIYWNGDSIANPKVEDFLTDGYKFKIIVYKKK